MRYFKTSLPWGFDMLFEVTEEGVASLTQWHQENKKKFHLEFSKDPITACLLYATRIAYTDTLTEENKEEVICYFNRIPEYTFPIDGSTGVKLVEYHRYAFNPYQFAIQEIFNKENEKPYDVKEVTR